MRMMISPRATVLAIVVAIAATKGATPAQAEAPITFGMPTTISADTDVFNKGTLLYAYGFGNPAAANTSLGVVNGVNFLNAGSFSNGQLSSGNGNVTVTNFSNTFASGAPTGVSTAYGSVLSNCVFVSTDNSGALTLGNLTAGTSYKVELFADDSTAGNNGSQRNETITDGSGDSVILKSNSGTGGGGSAGQFVIGSFTANATTEVLNFPSFTGAAYLNALSVEVVPEPATWAGGVLLLGVAGLALRQRRAGLA